MESIVGMDRGRPDRPSSGFRHSWLSFGGTLPPDRPAPQMIMTNVAVSVMFVCHGDVRGRLVCRGRESSLDCVAGAIRFHPADGLEHVSIGAAGSRGMRFLAFIIPPWQVSAVAEAEGLSRLPESGMRLWQSDAELQRCLVILAAAKSADAAVDAEDRDDAARSLMLRLAELTGAGRPDWYADTSMFTNRELKPLLAHIDAHLHAAPSADDMARMCGLSPSHFARKFRQSLGVSLQRFVNRRRLQTSLERLTRSSDTLPDIALDLGFSSQSHFTRLFSELTGMTPAKYRKFHARAIG